MPVANYNTRKMIAASLVASISIACSILITLKLVKNEGIRFGADFVSSVATELIYRGEIVSDQLNLAFEFLQKHAVVAPCSDGHIAAMQALAMRFSQIQMIGYSPQQQILCSSLGRHVPAISLPRADSSWQAKMAIYSGHEFPALADGVKLIVAERYGYVIAVLSAAPVDVLMTRRDLSLGIYSESGGTILTEKGRFDPAWLKRLGSANHVEFSDDRYIVALTRSPRHGFISFAAIPVANLDKHMLFLVYLFAPFCLIVSAILVFASFAVTRYYFSPKASLYAALRKHELFVEYQPIVDLRTRKWVGAEALVRWKRPDGRIIGPDVFIPLAEENQLIQHVTRRVLALVFQDAPDLLRIAPDFYVSVNLSSADLQSETLVHELGQRLEIAQLPPAFLRLEATERGFVNSETGRKVIRDIRAMGISVAIDDFGTGYSSLSYLGSFELDYLKIDKSFIDAFLNAANEIDHGSRMTLHIIEIAKTMQLQMIAEGVERETQAQELHRQGVEFAQGWLFGKPMKMSEILAFLVAANEQNTARAAARHDKWKAS